MYEPFKLATKNGRSIDPVPRLRRYQWKIQNPRALNKGRHPRWLFSSSISNTYWFKSSLYIKKSFIRDLAGVFSGNASRSRMYGSTATCRSSVCYHITCLRERDRLPMLLCDSPFDRVAMISRTTGARTTSRVSPAYDYYRDRCRAVASPIRWRECREFTVPRNPIINKLFPYDIRTNEDHRPMNPTNPRV